MSRVAHFKSNKLNILINAKISFDVPCQFNKFFRQRQSGTHSRDSSCEVQNVLHTNVCTDEEHTREPIDAMLIIQVTINDSDKHAYLRNLPFVFKAI